MHLRVIQRQLNFISNNLRRTYKHQTNVFGYNTQLKTIANTKDLENILRRYLSY